MLQCAFDGFYCAVPLCYVANSCESVNPGLSAQVEKAVQNAAEILALEHFK